MNLLFLYLTAAGMAVTLITGGSEREEGRTNRMESALAAGAMLLFGGSHHRS